MDAVKAYRMRKKIRLMARGYRADKDDVAEWITTDKGVHIPLDEDKTAVGGALKGETFDKASGNGNGTKPKRKQKEISDEKRMLLPNGRVKENCLDEFNKNAFNSIVEETGYGEEEAKKFHTNLLNFFGGDYSAFARGECEDQEKNIDDGLARMGAYDGEIYRGMNFDEWEKDALAKFKNCNVGDEIEMRTISSWSSDRKVANEFSGLGTMNGHSVVLVCKNNKSAVGVQHISKFAKKEAEVLAPSTARWRLKKKKTISRYKFLKDFYTNKIGMGVSERARILGMIEGLKGILSKRSVVTLEVEEI